MSQVSLWSDCPGLLGTWCCLRFPSRWRKQRWVITSPLSGYPARRQNCVDACRQRNLIIKKAVKTATSLYLVSTFLGKKYTTPGGTSNGEVVVSRLRVLFYSQPFPFQRCCKSKGVCACECETQKVLPQMRPRAYLCASFQLAHVYLRTEV